jgi:hypothetical protein
METTEQKDTKVQLATRVDPNVSAAIEKIVAEEERTVSNTIERLLKTHPRVQEIIEANSVKASA